MPLEAYDQEILDLLCELRFCQTRHGSGRAHLARLLAVIWTSSVREPPRAPRGHFRTSSQHPKHASQPCCWVLDHWPALCCQTRTYVNGTKYFLLSISSSFNDKVEVLC